MSVILSIESATPVCSVALSRDGEPWCTRELTGSNQHASMLTILIQEALAEAGISMNGIDAVSVSEGPGSYTGLRVGLSTAKGICYALDKPLIMVPTLEAMAYGFSFQHAPVETALLIPMIDARRMEVFCAVYNQSFQPILPPSAVILDEGSLKDFRESATCYLFGTGAAKSSSVLTGPNINTITDFVCSAAHQTIPATRAFQEQRFADVAYSEPFYLKEFYTPGKS